MDFITVIVQYIAQGGPAAVIAILCTVVVVLVWDRTRLLKDLDGTTKRVYDSKDRETEMLKEIIDKYHRGNIDLIHALNEIKVVLATIQNSRH